MEKRLFLAVFLSLVVVFGFQTLFPSQKQAQQPVQTIQVNAFVDNSTKFVASEEKSAEQLNQSKPSFDIRTEKISNNIYELKVSNKGLGIDEVFLKQYGYTFPIKNIAESVFLENKAYNLQVTSSSIIGRFENKDFKITKTLSLNDDYTFNIEIVVQNISDEIRKFDNKINSLSIDMSRVDTKTVQSDATLYEYSINTEKKIIRKDSATKFDDKWSKEESLDVSWIGFRDRYFAIIVEPTEKQKKYFVKHINDKELVLGTNTGIVIEPNKTVIYKFKIYAGPQKLDVLEKAGKGFTSLMVFSNWGWLDAISKAMYWLLGFLHSIIPSWGLCIIAISLIVYGIMYPLTAKSLVSMKKLQALQPQMKEIQEKYKNNPERLNKEVVELYRVNQVNPLGGCLPMLLQMPIFVGLYQVLWRSVYFRGESFLWMKDLALPDQTIKLPFTIPFIGEYVNVLPILMVGIMMVQQKFNMQTMATATPEQASQQKIMAILFPIMIGFIFYNMASGLNLYFVVFYLLSTITQWQLTKTVK